jgi:hypothetical protein
MDSWLLVDSGPDEVCALTGKTKNERAKAVIAKDSLIIWT